VTADSDSLGGTLSNILSPSEKLPSESEGCLLSLLMPCGPVRLAGRLRLSFSFSLEAMRARSSLGVIRIMPWGGAGAGAAGGESPLGFWPWLPLEREASVAKFLESGFNKSAG
jgi:hypothetical protein